MKPFTVVAPQLDSSPKSQTELAANGNYEEVTVDSFVLDSVRLDHLSIVDARMTGGSWINVEMTESLLRRVAIRDMRLSGLIAYSLIAENVVFTNCKLDMTNFRGSKFKNVQFTDCVLADADFQGSTFTNVEFTNCDIDKLDVNNCTFTNTDLRSSSFAGIKGAVSLRGATMARDQLIMLAPVLAQQIGIKLEDS